MPSGANVVVKTRARPKPPKPKKPPPKTSEQRKRDGERRAAKTSRDIATRRKRVKARRRREGTDAHEEQLPYRVQAIQDEGHYRRSRKRIRNARAAAEDARICRPEAGTVGGVRGIRVSAGDAKRAKMSMQRMHPAYELDHELDGKTVVVMGNSATLNRMDLSRLGSVPVVGCNRALRDKALWPEYLVIADREPYCQERDSDRLTLAADAGVKIILPDSIFDPEVRLRGPYRDPYRRGQPTPEFQAYLYQFGPKKKAQDYYDQVIAGKVKLPFSFDSFRDELVTCQNVCGSMLQTAVILGAKRIGFLGIELKWPTRGKSHFFGDGKSVGAYEPQGAFQKIVASMTQAKVVLAKRGVEVMNLSPVKDCPWASVWGNYPYDQFVEEHCG